MAQIRMLATVVLFSLPMLSGCQHYYHSRYPLPSHLPQTQSTEFKSSGYWKELASDVAAELTESLGRQEYSLPRSADPTAFEQQFNLLLAEELLSRGNLILQSNDGMAIDYRVSFQDSQGQPLGLAISTQVSHDQRLVYLENTSFSIADAQAGYYSHNPPRLINVTGE